MRRTLHARRGSDLVITVTGITESGSEVLVTGLEVGMTPVVAVELVPDQAGHLGLPGSVDYWIVGALYDADGKAVEGHGHHRADRSRTVAPQPRGTP